LAGTDEHHRGAGLLEDFNGRTLIGGQFPACRNGARFCRHVDQIAFNPWQKLQEKQDQYNRPCQPAQTPQNGIGLRMYLHDVGLDYPDDGSNE